MIRLNLVLFMLLAAVFSLYGGIQDEKVEYSADGVTLEGYLVYDDSDEMGKRPGILLVHEWWGLNDYARSRARELAELGYTALAVDMYGEGKTAEHPDDAGKFATQVMKNLDVAKARFMAALKLLSDHETVDPQNIAAIGYCFGGGVVLNMALMGVDINGVVSFHGSLPTEMPPGAEGPVKTKVLVCHGADDKFATPEQIDQFKKLMDEHKVDYTFNVYPNAMHSFTNPQATEKGKEFGLPLAYNKEADEQSWKDMQAFFDKIFAEE